LKVKIKGHSSQLWEDIDIQHVSIGVGATANQGFLVFYCTGYLYQFLLMSQLH